MDPYKLQLTNYHPILVSTLLQLLNNLALYLPIGWVGGTQVRLARGKQKSDSDDLDPTLDPVPQQCVRKTFSASFVPQPAENNTYS
jgi:hypothetical protein